MKTLKITVTLVVFSIVGVLNSQEKEGKIAYDAYMQGKKEAYTEHHNYCNNNCNHSYCYNYHARYYYRYKYNRQQRSTIRTNVRVGLPRVRIGLF